MLGRCWKKLLDKSVEFLVIVIRYDIHLDAKNGDLHIIEILPVD